MPWPVLGGAHSLINSIPIHHSPQWVVIQLINPQP